MHNLYRRRTSIDLAERAFTITAEPPSMYIDPGVTARKPSPRPLLFSAVWLCLETLIAAATVQHALVSHRQSETASKEDDYI